MSMNRKAGLFGLAMHACIVIIFLLRRMLHGDRFGPEMLFVGMPLLLVSAYVVYFFVVSRYLKRREGMVNPLFIDALVGILAEFIVFTLTGALFGIFDGLHIGISSGAGASRALLASVYVNILRVYADFMEVLPVLGTLCGLAGWFVLKRTKTAQ